jgi:hypothetical protein
MRSFGIENIFSEDDYLYLKNYIYNNINTASDFIYTEYYGRWWNIVELDDRINTFIMEAVRKHLGDNLVIAFNQCIKYQKIGDCIPKLDSHKDHFYNDYTLDITIDTTLNWPLEIEGQYLSCYNNSGIFLDGNNENHSRPEYPGSDNDYMVMLYVNLVDQNSDILNKINAMKGLSENTRKMLLSRMIPRQHKKGAE